MTNLLSQKSLTKLDGEHPDLVKVIKRAATLSDIDFTILEVVRTPARQRELVAKGASKTMNSRHLPGADGKSRAVDIAPLDGGQVSWAWPLYHKLAPIIKQAANDLDVPIEWGGDWRSFKDGPHWQLPWKAYP
jgi:peptidoglycan L-alanyl-D-glutamate endopeptidase CwlK